MGDSSQSPVKIGFAGLEGELSAACVAAAGTDYEVVIVPGPEAGDAPADMAFDVLLLLFAVPLRGAAAYLAQCRERSPLLPIIALAGDGVGLNVAVELVKCGADDALEVPFEAADLVAKLERVLSRRDGLSLTEPQLAPLAELMNPTPRVRAASKTNRRRCFRATIRPEMAPRVTLLLGGRALMVQAHDLSINGKDYAGGMLMSLPREMARSVPQSAWKTGSALEIELIPPGEASPIKTSAKLIGNRRGAGANLVRFAVMFGPQPHDVHTRLRNYWVALQRRASA